jgi:flagellin
MANIGATTAFYKVETSLTRANQEVSKSMERLATGKQNANAGDRSSYVAMSDTFRLDYVGTKAGIKGASVAMGYLETGMRVLDSASSLLSRLQELAVLGANNTNTTADNEAINLEAEAIADEFNRLMTTSTYKGKNVFVTAAGDQEIAMGGRGAEMTFGIGDISYTGLYSSTARTIAGEPNNAETFNLAHLPSDAVTAKTYGSAVTQGDATSGTVTLTADKKYVIRGVDATTDETDMTDSTNDPSAVSVKTAIDASAITLKDSDGDDVTATLASGNVIDVSTTSTIAQVNPSGEIQDYDGKADYIGAVMSFDGFTAQTDAKRVANTYTVTANSGGDDATFRVVVDTNGKANVTIVDGGEGFADNEVITIADTKLGGGGADDLEFTVAGVSNIAARVAASYTVTSDNYTTSGSGTGASFTIVINGDKGAYITAINDGGSGFVDNEVITVAGSTFGATDAADLEFVVNGVSDGIASSVIYAEVKTDENAFKSTETYVIQSLGSTNSSGTIATADTDANIISKAFTDTDGNQLTGTLSVGQKIKFASVGDTIGSTEVTQQHLDAANALIEGMEFTMSSDTLTADIESIQALINRARVEAGSQYAAMESAVSYTTDLTAQYELGFNTVNDVNFSAETAHLAKNQILQQAATAMLAQANSGQQGLLQLIQG